MRSVKIKVNEGGTNKTLTISDAAAASEITKAKVNAFITQYNNIYETDYELVSAVIAESTETTLNLN